MPISTSNTYLLVPEKRLVDGRWNITITWKYKNKDYLFADNFGGTAINSLGLDKIYVLTTDRSASASEGIINGLNPYIEIVQIGEATTGKTQASSLFYDSSNFGRQNHMLQYFFYLSEKSMSKSD